MEVPAASRRLSRGQHHRDSAEGHDGPDAAVVEARDGGTEADVAPDHVAEPAVLAATEQRPGEGEEHQQVASEPEDADADGDLDEVVVDLVEVDQPGAAQRMLEEPGDAGLEAEGPGGVGELGALVAGEPREHRVVAGQPGDDGQGEQEQRPAGRDQEAGDSGALDDRHHQHQDGDHDRAGAAAAHQHRRRARHAGGRQHDGGEHRPRRVAVGEVEQQADREHAGLGEVVGVGRQTRVPALGLLALGGAHHQAEHLARHEAGRQQVDVAPQRPPQRERDGQAEHHDHPEAQGDEALPHLRGEHRGAHPGDEHQRDPHRVRRREADPATDQLRQQQREAGEQQQVGHRHDRRRPEGDALVERCGEVGTDEHEDPDPLGAERRQHHEEGRRAQGDETDHGTQRAGDDEQRDQHRGADVQHGGRQPGRRVQVGAQRGHWLQSVVGGRAGGEPDGPGGRSLGRGRGLGSPTTNPGSASRLAERPRRTGGAALR